METVRVVWDGKCAVWLPRLKGDAARTAVGAKVLRPGLNTLPAAAWKRWKEHPGVANLGLGRKLRVARAADADVHAHVPDPDTMSLAELSVTKAMPYVEAETSVAQLMAWLHVEKRVTLAKAIEDRIAELEEIAELEAGDEQTPVPEG